MTATGAAQLSADTLSLQATGENAAALTVFWTGRTLLTTGVAIGAGVRCAAGLRRLYNGNASGGAIVRPGAGDASVSARSAAVGAPIIVGETRYYFTIYRDPHAATPCGNPLSTINLSSAVGVQWDP